MNAPLRPIIRWHGGKWMLAPWIIAHFPPHRVYVEPFGGGGSVLLRKPRCYAEIYNDLDEEIVNLFRVLRDPDGSERLIALLQLTPFSRADFEASYVAAHDPVERARLLVCRAFMGFGSDGATSEWRTGFRGNSKRSGTTPALDWMNYPDGLRQSVERLRGVVIENRDAREVMMGHDGPETLHYLDPPYMHSTRSKKARRKCGGGFGAYRYELDDRAHAELLEFLRALKGMVIVSGYSHPLYEKALADWTRSETVAMADGARERVEVLWINPACVEALGHGPLFEAAK